MRRRYRYDTVRLEQLGALGVDRRKIRLLFSRQIKAIRKSSEPSVVGARQARSVDRNLVFLRAVSVFPLSLAGLK